MPARPSPLSSPSEDHPRQVGEARKPRHRQVYETLLSEIQSGRLQPGDRLPTEDDLAKSFGASRSTVARAMKELKNKGLLSRTRGAGTHVAQEHIPGEQGSHIALLTPFAHSARDLGHIGGQIHHHLSDLASKRGDYLRLQLVGHTPTLGAERLDSMMTAVRALIDQKVDGVFYYPLELPPDVPNYNVTVVDRLVDAGIAVLVVDRDIVTSPQRSALPLVSFDNRRGGSLITNHLLERGAKRIAYIHSRFVSTAASDRLHGHHDALDDAGMTIDRSLVFRPDFDQLNEKFTRMLVDEVKPDAIICKQDHYAAIIGRHLMAAGVKAGSDILLAGFDDEPFSEMLAVPLTTIRFPADPFVNVCYDRLTSMIANPEKPNPGQTLIDIELVVRTSTSGV